jgi:hypothetical protein
MANDDELKLFETTPNLALIWSKLSSDLRDRLCQRDFHLDALRETQQSLKWRTTIDQVMEKLRIYELLDVKEKTRLMDLKFPEVSSIPGQWEHNLHVYRNVNKSACTMIGSMSCNNWSRWVKLLNELQSPESRGG